MELDNGQMTLTNVNVATQLMDPNSLFHTVQKMIALRKHHAAFAGSDMEWVEAGSPAVAAYLRRSADDLVLVLANLSPELQSITVPARFRKAGPDLISGAVVSLAAQVELPPYSFRWLQLPNVA